MNNDYYWEHVEDTDMHCPTATLLGGETWVCLDHGAPVSYVKLEPLIEMTLEEFRQGRPLTATLDGEKLEITTVEGNTSLSDLLQEARVGGKGVDIRFSDPSAEAEEAIREGEAELTHVGWYCAGGHKTESTRGLGLVDVNKPSIRLDDPCEFGVPVYVLTNAAPVWQPEPVDRSTTIDWDAVAGLIGQQVVVKLKDMEHVSPQAQITGTFTLIERPPFGEAFDHMAHMGYVEIVLPHHIGAPSPVTRKIKLQDIASIEPVL